MTKVSILSSFTADHFVQALSTFEHYFKIHSPMDRNYLTLKRVKIPCPQCIARLGKPPATSLLAINIQLPARMSDKGRHNGLQRLFKVKT